MFTKARWKLTLAFAAALALILLAAGSAVYFITSAKLYDRVNNDLQSRAEHEAPPLSGRLSDASHQGQPFGNVPIGPDSAAAGYFYSLVDQNGNIIVSSPPVQAQDLATSAAEQKALASGSTFVNTKSSEGDSLRVYVKVIQDPSGQNLFLEVGRSIQAEQNLMRELLIVLSIGGASAIVLALAGGFVIAGRALNPIREAMDRQHEFVADASHELRTPLALIRTSAELIKRHPAQTVEANMEPVDDVIRETDRLSSLVGQMLALARADAGQAPLEMSAIDIGELTADVVRQMRLLCEPQAIPLELRSDGVPKVTGDPSRLRELLLILLDNAIKYGGAEQPIDVDLQSHNGKVVLRVSDRGPGIPHAALPHIFDRFYRVDKARSREKGGSGLGLSIAKWIVEAHKGTIHIDSVEGRGTSVTVELPTG